MATETAETRAATGSEFTLYFGALSGSIREQLANQNIELTAKDERRLQRAADGITFLSVHRLLSESESRKARQRIVNQVSRLAFRNAASATS